MDYNSVVPTATNLAFEDVAKILPVTVTVAVFYHFLCFHFVRLSALFLNTFCHSRQECPSGFLTLIIFQLIIL